jgi:REP-associated tyrosine transposase
MRYIELNPVRARMVSRPEEYLWSSFRANACGVRDELLVPHAIYGRLGESPDNRQAAYRELFQSSISESYGGQVGGRVVRSHPVGKPQDV